MRGEKARERAAAQGIRTVHLDYADPSSVEQAVQGIDRLFLVTGYSVEMLMHSKLVLDAASRAGVRHIVHMGAGGSDAQPFPHLAWHAFVERYIEALGFGYTHLRPRTFMDNLLRVVRPGSAVIRQFFGMSPVAWVAVEDIAAVAEAVLVNPEGHMGRAYEIAGETATMPQVVEALTEVTGIAFRYEAMDPARLQDILAKAGMESCYAASLASAIAAVAGGTFPAAVTGDNPFDVLTGITPTRWRDFAALHRDTFRRALPAAG